MTRMLPQVKWGDPSILLNTGEAVSEVLGPVQDKRESATGETTKGQ